MNNDYVVPGVYKEVANTPNTPKVANSISTGCLIGVTPRGVAFKPTFITSWTEYVKYFARDLDTPFTHPFSYQVLGFFVNGGSALYVERVCKKGSKLATKAIGEEPNALKFTALEVGVSDIEVLVTVTEALIKIVITYKGKVVETYTNLSNDNTNKKYFKSVINSKSNYISIEGSGELTAQTIKLEGGSTDYETVADADYQYAIEQLTKTIGVRTVGIPYCNTAAVVDKLITACEQNDMCPILATPIGSDRDEAKTYRESVAGEVGGMYYPNLKVKDQIIQDNILVVPNVGYVMGAIATNIDSKTRGVDTAPAGITAVLKGVVGLENEVTKEGDIAVLNPIGLNCLFAHKTAGIIIWGARSLNPEDNYKFISNILFDQYITAKSMDATEFACFRNHNSKLYEDMTLALTEVLNDLFKAGKLSGSTEEEAYFVKCDEENNDADSKAEGLVVADIGYARDNPAEFILLRIKQNQIQ